VDRFRRGDLVFDVLAGFWHWMPDEVPDAFVALLLEQVAAHPA
jgi:hypothetical protein